MYTLKSPNLYPGNQLAVSSISGQHSNRFHNSRTLSNAVPLGFCCGGFSSTAGYDPATRLNLRWAASRPLAGPCLRVPLVFIRVARESLATFSSWTFRFQLRASWNQQPPVFSLARASPHRLPIPSSVSNAVTFVTGCLYASIWFRSNFCVFFFRGYSKSCWLKICLSSTTFWALS